MPPVRVAMSTIAVGSNLVHAYVSASAMISRPSASVLVTSTVAPFIMVMMSSGRYAVESTMFSAHGSKALTRTGKSLCAINSIAPNTPKPPQPSYFMPSMPLLTLREYPPES